MDTYAPMKTNYFVADSALYSKSYLLNHSHHTLWISRVPESVNKAKTILERGHKGTDWIKLKGGLKYRAFKMEHCGIQQRWFVVHSHKAYFKEKTNFENRLDEKEYELHRTVNKLKRQLFKEKDVALETAKKIRGSYPFHKVKTRVVPHYEGYIASDQRYMALQGYAVEVEYQRNFEKIKRARNRKGKWIVATNIKEWEKTDPFHGGSNNRGLQSKKRQH